jgi:hypothetical protein
MSEEAGIVARGVAGRSAATAADGEEKTWQPPWEQYGIVEAGGGGDRVRVDELDDDLDACGEEGGGHCISGHSGRAAGAAVVMGDGAAAGNNTPLAKQHGVQQLPVESADLPDVYMRDISTNVAAAGPGGGDRGGGDGGGEDEERARIMAEI